MFLLKSHFIRKKKKKTFIKMKLSELIHGFLKDALNTHSFRWNSAHKDYKQNHLKKRKDKCTFEYFAGAIK